jgi:uncharacterized membrane protein
MIMSVNARNINYKRNFELENLIAVFNTLSTIAANSTDAVISTADKTLTDLLDSFERYFIVNAASMGYSSEQIKDLMNLPEEKFEEIIDQIEDEELSKLVEERVAKYGSWEELEKHCISHEELMLELGITDEDIENAEDDLI